MRRREIQSFTIKLNDLKEYEDAVRQERLENRAHQNKTENCSLTDSPMKLVPRWGPKSKQEVRDRIGLKS